MLETPKIFSPDMWDSEKDTTMDNQQELVYLAGIIDGEGSIGLFSFKRSHGITMHSRVSITNTSQVLVDYLASLFAKLEIPFHIGWFRPRNPRQRPWANVTVHRHSGVKKLLSLVRAFLIAKPRQADLLFEFVSSRLHADGKPKRNGKFYGYTKRDFEIERELKALNGVPKSLLNDCTLGSVGEDTVCAAAKVAD